LIPSFPPSILGNQSTQHIGTNATSSLQSQSDEIEGRPRGVS
jgi:hypothetical protein